MKKIVVLLITVLLINSVALATGSDARKFNDLSEQHWAYNDILSLIEKGTLSGYEDGTFKPDRAITRAEAAKILMTTFFDKSDIFKYSYGPKDVPVSHWANEYVTNGHLYILPDENGYFRPDEYITRGDFAFAVHKIIKHELPNSYMSTKNFSDVPFSDDRYDAISTLAGNGIINGFENNTFRPNESLTRAQVCKIINVAHNYIKDKYINNMRELGGWASYEDKHNIVRKINKDAEGYLIAYIGGKYTPVDLYYNGVYVTTANETIKKVKVEKISTSDGKEWKIKWYGDDVVELNQKNEKYIIKDNYSGISKIFDSKYLTFEEMEDTMKYFTGLEFKINKVKDQYATDGFTYFLQGPSGGPGMLDYIEKDGKKAGNISYISQAILDLYYSNWKGVDKETKKNATRNDEETNNIMSIPDIPIESFASLAKRHITSMAYKEDVGVIYLISYVPFESGEMKKSVSPIYMRLKGLYSGNTAEEIIEEYNKDAITQYNKKDPDSNLYCVLFDVDLKDYTSDGSTYYTYASFFTVAGVRVVDLKNGMAGNIYGTSIPRESKKLFYNQGDLTQIYIVFETPKDVEVSYVTLSFLNYDDETFEIFYISNMEL